MLVSPCEKPDQLVDDRLQVQLLGGDQRKAVGQIEAHLVAEHAERAGAGAVGLAHALRAHAAHEVEILLHGANVVRFRGQSKSCRLTPAGRHEAAAPARSANCRAHGRRWRTRRLPVRHSSQEKNSPISEHLDDADERIAGVQGRPQGRRDQRRAAEAQPRAAPAPRAGSRGTAAPPTAARRCRPPAAPAAHSARRTSRTNGRRSAYMSCGQKMY